MIGRVSFSGINANQQQPEKKRSSKVSLKAEKIKPYADSFVKNCTQSAPMFLGLTAIWTLIDNKTASMSLKKAAVNNITKFFLPVLIGSSLLLSVIDNKSKKKAE